MLMEEKIPQDGEFHHFQLVDQDGNIPFSISVLVHYNQKSARHEANLEPISSNDIIEFHDALRGFDGDYIAALSKK